MHATSLARRGGRYPGRAPTGSVGLAGRLLCGARVTRAAAMPLASGAERAAASWLLAGPAPAGPDSPLCRCAPRRPTSRPPRIPPAAQRRSWCCSTNISVVPGKAVVGYAPAATLHGAEQRRAHGRARTRALRPSDSRRLFDHSERSERREFRRGPCDRAAQGSRPAGPTAVHERRCIPGRGFASLGLANRNHTQ